MDIAALFPISQVLPIRAQDGSETDITFKVVGADSKPFRDAALRNFVKRAQRAKDGEAALTPELASEHFREETELLAVCIQGWENLTANGEPIPFSVDKATELLLKPELYFVRDQVEEYVTNRTHFFRSGSNPA